MDLSVFSGMCLPWSTRIPLNKLPSKLCTSLKKAGFGGDSVSLEDIVPYSRLTGLSALDRAKHVVVESKLSWNNIPKLFIEVNK